MKSISMAGRLILISALALSAVGITLAEDANTSIGEELETVSEVVIANVNLVDEWVEISNLGDDPQDLTGWTLNDEQNHTYSFPEEFVLEAGGIVVVHTGVGEDSESDLYMNQGNPIWNNDGDVATLMDDNGDVVSQLNLRPEEELSEAEDA